ncbi:MAG: hypothetical protein DIU79_06620 [Actinobacteria bacterium]|nr:MAG: hypothetical protein DIU79_06620 [Actinomycetota bacterium]
MKRVEVRGRIEVLVDGQVTDGLTADVDDSGQTLTLRNNRRVLGAYPLVGHNYGPQAYQQPETD